MLILFCLAGIFVIALWCARSVQRNHLTVVVRDALLAVQALREDVRTAAANGSDLVRFKQAIAHAARAIERSGRSSVGDVGAEIAIVDALLAVRRLNALDLNAAGARDLIGQEVARLELIAQKLDAARQP